MSKPGYIYFQVPPRPPTTVVKIGYSRIAVHLKEKRNSGVLAYEGDWRIIRTIMVPSQKIYESKYLKMFEEHRITGIRSKELFQAEPVLRWLEENGGVEIPPPSPPTSKMKPYETHKRTSKAPR